MAAAAATIVVGTSVLAANALVDTAAKFEKYQTILETTERSGEKAKKAMAWVTNFAVNTPYLSKRSRRAAATCAQLHYP